MNPVCTCGTQCHWENDFDTEDYGIERKGVVGLYTCPNCGSEVQVTAWCETEEEFEQRSKNGNQH